jgi:hypothetical protein
MQIVVDKVLKFVHDYSSKKESLKKHKAEKKILLFLFIWELAKHIMVWNCPKDDIWNLKLSYLNESQ